MFKEVTFVDLWEGLKNVDAPSLPETYELDALLALLKFADGMIHEDKVKTVKALQLQYFIPIIRELVDFESWIPIWGENFINIKKLDCTTSCIQLLLGIFQTCVNPSYREEVWIDCTELTVILIGMNLTTSMTYDRFLGMDA
jgi:hypothetical protein